MKKVFLILAFFGVMSSCFCKEIYYEVKADTGLFENDEYGLFKRNVQEQRGMIRMMKKGEKVKYTFGDRYSLELVTDILLSYIVVTDQNGIKGKVAWADLFLPSNNSLPDEIKNEERTYEHCNARWISAYYYDVLSGTKNLFECEPSWKEWHSDSQGLTWYDAFSTSNLMIFDNAISITGYDTFGGTFLITSSEKVKDGIKIGLFLRDEIHPNSIDIFMHHFKEGEQEITLKIDGDYLEMYLDGSKSPLMIFARTDDYKGIHNKLGAIIFGKEIDLNDITFPRHADGSSDFDDRIEPPSIRLSENNKAGNATADASGNPDASAESATPKPAPASGKTAVVTENLRLRTDDTATAEVVTTLAAGTRVKVLAPGREDTIDGIASGWVQVGVLDGAKDKDGNAIAAGTAGWLFGGYLSEAEEATLPESAESERPGEKAAAKEALPIVPIAAGIAALAVLVVVALLAAKKRKGGKE